MPNIICRMELYSFNEADIPDEKTDRFWKDLCNSVSCP